jgi:SAM-dependent methyltransferase
VYNWLKFEQMKQIKHYLIYLIFRLMGTGSFVRRLEWRRMLEWLSPRKDERILDVACGMGELSLLIARRGAEVFGLDMSEAAIEAAERLSRKVKIPCEFRVGDAQKLPYPDGYFDKIVCSSSLEHFEDDSLAVGEMRRVLKNGGRVVLTTDSFTLPIKAELKERHRRKCSVMHYYTRESMEASFRNCNLGICRSDYLIKSSLASFFLKQWIKYPGPAVFWIAVAFCGYPFFIVSEKLAGGREGGYTLIAEAVKSG